MIGQTISHYKILEKLGEGGMGVVYKAQDTKLDRLVALKFLPAHVSVNEETKARFVQEAKAAAALNHNNICTIHGVEEHDGNMFIVMEFIEGGTLRQKLPYAKTDDALNIALQIGEALQEAHAKGIVHRDIKSDNVMLTSKGQAKVMDFGLAKLKGSLKLTRTSSTVGTLAYMAPEQIQGGEVDSRSDIFSFGVLLFEMLSGKLPFRGEHEAAMVYSIVNEEPEPIQQHRPQISSEVVHILEKALEKNPADRFQSAADMVVDLRRALKQSSKISSSAVSSAHRISSPQTEAIPATAQPSRKNLLMGVGGLVVLTVFAAIYFLLINKTNDPGSVAHINANVTLRVLPIPFNQFSYPGLSKDGNWVAFPAANANMKWDIYYMHISGSEPRRITTDSIGSGFNLSAEISPDGSLIAYQRPSSNASGIGIEICIISSLGGPSKRIVQNGTLARWRPDGQRIGYVRFRDPSPKGTYNLWSMKPDGSDNRPEFADTLGGGGRFSRYSFNWSPDGRSIAWIRSFQGGYQEVITRELESGKERQLTFDKKNVDDVAWTKNGFVIYSSNRSGNTNLWIVPVEGGNAQQLTKGSGPDIGMSVSADDQRLVYLQQQQVGTLWVTDLNSSRSQQVTFDDRVIESLALSPDGKKIAYTMGDIDPLKPGVGLYLQDRDGGNRRQLNSEAVGILSLSWSADGNRIGFSMVRLTEPVDSAKLYVVNAKDPGEPKQLTSGIRFVWLDAGRFVATKTQTRDGNVTTHDEIMGIDETTPRKRLDDSVSIVRVISGNLVLLQDRHQTRQGLWTVSSEYLENPSKVNPKKMMIPEGTLKVNFGK
ncbi:MAG: Protein kinase protein [Bacteroidetes bacterium]|nr:Protein kinase protein [Bacteroidota bacterium]